MKFFKLSHVSWEEYEPHILSHRDDSMTSDEFACLVNSVGNQVLEKMRTLIKTDCLDVRSIRVPEFTRAVRNKLILNHGFEPVQFAHEMKVFGGDILTLWRGPNTPEENFKPSVSYIHFLNSYDRFENLSDEAVADQKENWQREFGDTTE